MGKIVCCTVVISLILTVVNGNVLNQVELGFPGENLRQFRCDLSDDKAVRIAFYRSDSPDPVCKVTPICNKDRSSSKYDCGCFNNHLWENYFTVDNVTRLDVDPVFWYCANIPVYGTTIPLRGR